jgi:hypothetical protein
MSLAAPRRLRLRLKSVALHELAMIKNDAFEEEHDWRFSAVCELQYLVGVRAQRSGLVPFLDVAVNVTTADATRLPPTNRAACRRPRPRISWLAPASVANRRLRRSSNC